MGGKNPGLVSQPAGGLAMRRRQKRLRRDQTGTFNLSFLDAISCGFGAIVVLLVLTKAGEPGSIEKTRLNLDVQIAELQQELQFIRDQTRNMEKDLKSRLVQISKQQDQVAGLRGDLSRIQGQFETSRQTSQVQDILQSRLALVQQKLTQEMKRLQAQSLAKPTNDKVVGGIPVDSEYIIFIIDTSGSMKGFAWQLAIKKMDETLNIYPKVKGIQIMNDMGHYMFTSYAGEWIPDTPARRRAILQRMQNWNAFSNSSPVEGITRAIQKFAAADKKVSIYVFGDEFTGDSIQEVIDRVDRINPKDEQGNPRVRIHGVGFPVVFSGLGLAQTTGIRFATLMRALCHRNGGTFVGLNSAIR